MAAITVRAFNGISPKTPPRYLKDQQAQIADNCDVFRGSLRPLKGLGTTVANIVGSSQTIYKFGQDNDNPASGWLGWGSDVDVCRSQIAGDTEEWTFYTGDGYPKAIRAGYTNSPIPLGLPAPSVGLELTLGADPADTTTLTRETRVYTYTYVNKVGVRSVESAPAPPSDSVDVWPGQDVAVSGVTTPPSGYAATHVRIYRAVSGSFLFVTELTLASAIGGFNDTIDPEDLGEVIPSIDWLAPPDDLAGLINLPNGVMAGFVSRDVYFCEPYVPHAWPDAYRQTIDFPVVGLGRMDTTLAVLTKGTPYFIQGSHPDSVVVVKSDIEQACISKRSIVSFNNTVIYASPDGLVSLSSNGSSLLTQSMYTQEQWQTLINPSSIVAFHTDMKYVGFYDNGTATGSFVFDFATGQFTLNDVYATVGYHNLRDDTLYLMTAGEIKPWNEGSELTYQWKSKLFALPAVMGMSCAQVEAEAYPVTMKIYADGSLIHTQTVTSRFPFRLPPISARDWEFEITGTNEIFSAALSQSMSELANV
jgi:hypothetical protein